MLAEAQNFKYDSVNSDYQIAAISSIHERCLEVKSEQI